MKNSHFLENLIPKSVIDPVDFNTAAMTGNRIDMKDLEKVVFVLMIGSATTRTAATFDFDQHTVGSSGTPAALPISNKYYHKVGAATSFTEVEVNTPEDEYDLLSLIGDSNAIVVFEVNSSDLTDGYRWISMNAADSGAASIGAVMAFGVARYKPAAALVV